MTHHEPEAMTPSGPAGSSATVCPTPTYETPHMYVVGTALDLVQGSITGQGRDGHPNGWYIYQG